jgi:hypothetical protein
MSKKSTAWNPLLMVLVIAPLSGFVLPATGAGQTILGVAPSELRSPVTISPGEPLSEPTRRFSANLIPGLRGDFCGVNAPGHSVLILSSASSWWVLDSSGIDLP